MTFARRLRGGGFALGSGRGLRGGSLGQRFLGGRLAHRAQVHAAAGLLLLGFCGWLLLGLEQAIGTYGPWVTAHADIIAGTVIVIAVSIAWQLAKKDNPSW